MSRISDFPRTKINPLEQKTLEQLYITLDAICQNRKLNHSIRFVTTTHSGVLTRRTDRPYYVLEVNGIHKLATIRDFDRASLLRSGIVAIKEAVKKGLI